MTIRSLLVFTVAAVSQLAAAQGVAPPSGWVWEREGIRINFASATGNGRTQYLPTGLVSVARTDEPKIIVTVTQIADVEARGSSKIAYRPAFTTPDGAGFANPSASGVTGFTSGATVHWYHFDDEALLARDRLTLGVAKVDLATRRAASAAAKAARPGARVLPLPVVGEPLGFTLRGSDGSTVRDEDFRGKVLLIDAWATWCIPCMQKMPILDELKAKYPDDLAVLGINFDVERAAMDRAIDDVGIGGTQVHAAMSAGEHPDAWNTISYISTLPRLLLVDREGVLRGELLPHELRSEVGKLVEGRSRGARDPE